VVWGLAETHAVESFSDYLSREYVVKQKQKKQADVPAAADASGATATKTAKTATEEPETADASSGPSSVSTILTNGRQMPSISRLIKSRFSLPIMYNFAVSNTAVKQGYTDFDYTTEANVISTVIGLKDSKTNPDVPKTVTVQQLPLPSPYDSISAFESAPPAAPNQHVDELSGLHAPSPSEHLEETNATKPYKKSLGNAAAYIASQVNLSQASYWNKFDADDMREAQAHIHEQISADTLKGYIAQNIIYTHDDVATETLLDLLDYASRMSHRDMVYNLEDKETKDDQMMVPSIPKLLSYAPVKKMFVMKQHKF
jgi:hypothetical protein